MKGLADKVRELFAMADEAYRQGRVNGDAVDYAAFEERVSQASAEFEYAVHQRVLGSLCTGRPDSRKKPMRQTR